jgi:ribonuclease G
MQNEILINATRGETRVAILEKKQFVELHIERARSKSVVGSVVKGRVTRVLPGMQAAFVDIGLEKAAFLYAGDYVENIERLDGEEEDGRSRRRRNRKIPSIETLMSEGQEIVVQIAKEPIGTKGARITSHVSIAGRHLVLTPWAQRVGVSRKIDSDRERRRLRDIVNRTKPADLGFIIRTAGEGTRDADLEADVKYLTTVWDDVQIKKDQVRAPANLYEEPSLALRVIRDFANSDTKRVVIDSREAWEEMKAFVDEFVADPKPKIELYDADEPIFDHFGAEAEIDTNLGRKVWLKSGGYLIVDQSEALTAIDVNTGRYVGKRDLEETVLRTNLEAVREVVQQLRFRNIGGLIIIDLIDMESAANRDQVYRALQEVIRGDKAKTNILKISELGLVEMTRKRTRENLVQTLCEPCPYCEGKGYVLSDESVAHKLLRELRKDLPRFAGRKVALTVNRRVAEQLLGPERGSLEALEAQVGREMEVRARADLHQEQFEISALEEGEAVTLSIPWLTDAPEDEPEAKAAGRGGRRRSRTRSASGESAEAEAPAAAAAVAGTAVALAAEGAEAAADDAAEVAPDEVAEPATATEPEAAPEEVAEAPADAAAPANAGDDAPEVEASTPEAEPAPQAVTKGTESPPRGNGAAKDADELPEEAAEDEASAPDASDSRPTG